MSRFIQTVAVLALEAIRKVVAAQTKHAQRLFEMQLNGLEYDRVPISTLNRAVRLNYRTPYSIGIDDWHHDDCVQHVVN